MIKIRDLRKDFSRYGFSLSCSILDIADGDSLGIYGPTGSGKTLFTKTAAGLTGNYSGSVEIARSELRNIFKKKIGYVPFRNALYPNLTLREMSVYLLKQYRSSPAEYRTRSEWFRDFFDVASRSDEKVYSITDGQLQWFKIFCALLHSPQVLIIDEPFNGLGSSGAPEIRELFSRITSIGVTVLAASSSRDLLASVTGRITEINNGIIE